DVAGATHHDRRDARTRDERLQLRFPRRNADGQSRLWLARADLQRACRPGSKWSSAGCIGGLVFFHLLARNGAVRPLFAFSSSSSNWHLNRLANSEERQCFRGELTSSRRKSRAFSQ